jgi:Skp family chaperone for outer membrane proteins
MKDGLIYGIFGGIIGSLYMGWICSSKSFTPHPTSLAIVDMQLLISKKSQQLAMSQASERHNSQVRELFPLSQQSIQEAANHLKDDLNTFAVTHNLVLLAKGVVAGGDIPDKTQEVLAMIEKGDGMNRLFG